MPNPLVFHEDENGEGYHHHPHHAAGNYAYGHQHPQQPYHQQHQQPYSSGFGFAATSWQLRKNLTEAFNQQASSSDDDKSKQSESSTVVEQQRGDPKPASSKTSIFQKIAHFEKTSTEKRAAIPVHNPTKNFQTRSVFHFPASHHGSNKETTVAAPFGRPPRQPTGEKDNSTSASSAVAIDTSDSDEERRCVSVYLRVRPPKEGMVNTIEILPGDPATRVRTHAPHKK